MWAYKYFQLFDFNTYCFANEDLNFEFDFEVEAALGRFLTSEDCCGPHFPHFFEAVNDVDSLFE